MSGWVSQALTDQHKLEELDSGQPDLDRWLVGQALRAHGDGSAHTTVWTAAGHPVVRAFHVIAPTQFVREDLPSRQFVGGYSTVPGFLIGRLALDRELHGQGLGSQLLLDALERVADAADIAGGRLVAVDAIDQDPHRFYVHHGFQPVADTSRLVMKIATARSVITR